MKKPLILFILTLISFITFGQETKKELPQFSTYHKNIYIETWGSHLLVGVNFDMRLKKGMMDGLGFRVGIGGFDEKGTHGPSRELRYQYYPDDFFGKDFSHYPFGMTIFPFEINYLMGEKRSSFITGLGFIPVIAIINGNRYIAERDFLQKRSIGVIGSFINIGYRFQPLRRGLMFQINWNPMLIRNKGFDPFWVGIGIGVGFK